MNSTDKSDQRVVVKIIDECAAAASMLGKFSLPHDEAADQERAASGIMRIQGGLPMYRNQWRRKARPTPCSDVNEARRLILANTYLEIGKIEELRTSMRRWRAGISATEKKEIDRRLESALANLSQSKAARHGPQKRVAMLNAAKDQLDIIASGLTVFTDGNSLPRVEAKARNYISFINNRINGIRSLIRTIDNEYEAVP